MKPLYLLLFFFTFSLANAQWSWHDPQKAGFPVIQNQGWTNEIGKTYTRLPNRAESSVRPPVWNLSRNSSGLSIRFYSNAPQIKVRYTVSDRLNMPHMPSTGVSGIDLYSKDENGTSHFCYGGYSFGDTIQYHYNITEKSPFHSHGYEYSLYLPLYNSVEWMEIGVPDGSKLGFVPLSGEKPIVVYGTSVSQGACASRPGMAWSTILQRSLEYPLINLGFSGNGRLEESILQLITEIDARLYILDCMPNIYEKTEPEIVELVCNAIRQIRKTRDTPILLVDHAGCSNATTDSTMRKAYTLKNQSQHKAFELLTEEGIKNIFYLSHNELNLPADGWVDYVHPSDLGMQAQSRAVEKKVREIVKLPVGTLPTTIPVTQRREANNYEWQTRHQDILALNRKEAPKAVILGNSITHFWGGEPVGPRLNGAKSWNSVMRKAGFRNMGYGWDRIENVLWRVYHDELSGFEAEKIVLMIGTNNVDINSDDDIIEGLRFLLSAIRERQPKAAIKVVGILPRKDREARIRQLNKGIHEMAGKEGYIYTDAGVALLGKDGKINDSLFSDGVHPNEEGYRLIAPAIASF